MIALRGWLDVERADARRERSVHVGVVDTTVALRGRKAAGEKIVVVTAYDHMFARLADRAGVDVVLVGDSLGMVFQGQASTLPVTVDEMAYHTRAVARGASTAMVVGDLPFLSYQVSIEEGVRNAGRFLKEAGAHAVKLEGPQVELTR